MNHIETIRNLLAAGERTRSEIVMAIGGDRAKIDNALADLMSRGDVEVGTGDYGMRVYRLADKVQGVA